MPGLPIAYHELEAIYARTLGQGMRSLAVCAAKSGEGVTTLVEALAQRSRVTGRRVLLVEMNLYQPTLAAHFGVERQAWLPSGGKLSVEQAALPIIHQQGGLGILPASLAREASMRLRDPEVLASSLQGWLEHYDHVLFDTSPLTATNQNNIPAEQVCAACDGCVLIVLAGRTSETAVRQAMRHLQVANARLVGAVLNDLVNPSLAHELLRETWRLERRAPRLAAWLRTKISASGLLNVPV
jgi:protein-tyrosine kinase